MNRGTFVAHDRQILVPDLSSGDIVIMDKLFSHKAFAARKAIGARRDNGNPVVTASIGSRRAAHLTASQRSSCK